MTRFTPAAQRIAVPVVTVTAAGVVGPGGYQRAAEGPMALAARVEPAPRRDDGGPELSEVRTLPVADISVGYSPRETKVDGGHVASLMEVVDHLPPVIVDRTMTVIDGIHRLEAFRRAGRSHIKALMFNGNGTEAMALAIQANVKHGKPLSRGERRVAARSLLYAFPERSDRWMGEVCGLSHTTIALIRKSLCLADSRVRTGRDGRRRPVDRLAGQMAVARVIADNPAATVRQAAGVAGVAPSTAHRARARLYAQENPSPAPEAPAVPPMQGPYEADGRAAALPPFPELDEAASWLARTTVNIEDLRTYLVKLPLSRVYTVVDECRRRAQIWGEIAAAVEGRARCSASSQRRP
jgi:ParB-like chromosome segregation protein Spo0J